MKKIEPAKIMMSQPLIKVNLMLTGRITLMALIQLLSLVVIYVHTLKNIQDASDLYRGM